MKSLRSVASYSVGMCHIQSAAACRSAVVAVLHVAPPAKYRVNPPWVLPAVLLGLLAALIIGDPGRIDRQKTWLRVVTGRRHGYAEDDERVRTRVDNGLSQLIHRQIRETKNPV